MVRRQYVKPYVPTLAVALVLLYLALPGVQPSVAEMMPATMVFEASRPVSREELEVARDLLEQRLMFLAGRESMPADDRHFLITRGERLVFSWLPGIESSLVIAQASRVGRVEIVDCGTQYLPVGAKVKTGPDAIPDQEVYQVVLAGTDFLAAGARPGDEGRPVIQFALTSAGDARLADYTTHMRGYYLCLVVDGEVVNCPILRTPLADRRGIIELTGDATLDDARMWSAFLRFGPLPLAFKLSDD